MPDDAPDISRVHPIEGEPFRFHVDSLSKPAETYLVDMQLHGWSGECSCYHWMMRLGNKVAAGKRGEMVRCKHIKIAREAFLDLVLPKLAEAMGMVEPDIMEEFTPTTEYGKARLEFLKLNRTCAVYPAMNATEVHHQRGRLGPLLIDQRFWIPVSRLGHIWIDSHRNEARQRTWNGIPLLAQIGDWNKSP